MATPMLTTRQLQAMVQIKNAHSLNGNSECNGRSASRADPIPLHTHTLTQSETHKHTSAFARPRLPTSLRLESWQANAMQANAMQANALGMAATADELDLHTGKAAASSKRFVAVAFALVHNITQYNIARLSTLSSRAACDLQLATPTLVNPSSQQLS